MIAREATCNGGPVLPGSYRFTKGKLDRAIQAYTGGVRRGRAFDDLGGSVSYAVIDRARRGCVLAKAGGIARAAAAVGATLVTMCLAVVAAVLIDLRLSCVQ